MVAELRDGPNRDATRIHDPSEELLWSNHSGDETIADNDDRVEIHACIPTLVNIGYKDHLPPAKAAISQILLSRAFPA